MYIKQCVSQNKSVLYWTQECQLLKLKPNCMKSVILLYYYIIIILIFISSHKTLGVDLLRFLLTFELTL
jgi:hypothetical protein